MNEVINPIYKNGVKTLTETQIKNGLPGYDLLMAKIDAVRKNASEIGKRDIEIFENLKYDNILSILGGRGAGKTSILFTLYHYLKDEMDNGKNINVLMPLVMPELIDDNDGFIGWILASVEKNLNLIENEIKQYGFRGEDTSYGRMCKKYNFFNRCVFNERNGLREAFLSLKKAYHSKKYISRRGEWDYSTDLEVVSNISCKSFDLIEKFSGYWNKLAETYKELNNTKQNTTPGQEPLIFFMIDDADLKPQILNELIFALPKFFSHPNVVVIISASHKILNFTLKNYMYEQITRSTLPLMDLMDIEYKHNYEDREDDEFSQRIKFHELRYGREYDKIKTLTDEILRKLFPVSNRFYLKKYERYEEKCALGFEVSRNNTVRISNQFAEKLSQFKKEILEIHQKNVIGTHKRENKTFKNKAETLEAKEKNFTLIKKGETFEMNSPIYLSFLGKYPRDIVGGYYAFCDLLDEFKIALQKFYIQNEKKYDMGDAISDSFIDEMYDICMNFMNSIITSNRHLKPFCRNASELIFKKKMHWRLYVDYSMVLDVLCNPNYYSENKKTPSHFVEMLCLLNFVEQLIVLVYPTRMTSHGFIEFRQLLKKCDINIIKCGDDLDIMLRQFYEFKSHNVLQNFDKTKTEHQDVFLDVAYRLNLAPMGGVLDVEDEFKNREWYNLLYDICFYRFSFVGLLRENRSRLFIFDDKVYVDESYESIYKNYYDLLYNRVTLFPIEDNGSAKAESTMSMNESILVLSEVIDALTLVRVDAQKPGNNSDDIIFLLADELENVYTSLDFRIMFNNFVDILERNDFRVNRKYLINTLNKIEDLVKDEERKGNIAQISWLRRLKLYFKHSYEPLKDESYEKYQGLCNGILKEIESFVQSLPLDKMFSDKKINRIRSINKMEEIFKKLLNNKRIQQYFINVEESEFRKLKGVEPIDEQQ